MTATTTPMLAIVPAPAYPTGPEYFCQEDASAPAQCTIRRPAPHDNPSA